MKNSRKKSSQHQPSCIYGKNTVGIIFFAYLSVLVGLLVSTNSANAAAANATATILVNEQLTIDLTTNITNVQVPAVMVLTQPGNGTATEGSGLTIIYTPGENFIGSVSFSYQVFENVSGEPVADSTATITVNVISDATAQAKTVTPQQSLGNYLESICAVPPATMQLLCNDYNNATAGERVTLLNELSPKEVAAQKYTSNAMAIQQLDNIRQRLSALRQGQRAMSSANLAYNYHDPLNTADSMIAQWSVKGTGGGASADVQTSSSLGVFISGNYGGGAHDATDSEDGFDYSSMGITGGADYRTAGGLVIGGALGYAINDTSLDSGGGTMNVDGTSLLAYASYSQAAAWFVDAVFSYQSHDYDTTRNINYTSNGVTTFATADSQTASTMTAMSMGGGYEIFYKQGFSTTLQANVDYLQSSIDGYQETNAGIYNLSIAGRDTEQLTSSLGAQATYAISQSWGVIIPQLDFAWKHEFIDDAETVRGTFVSDSSGTTFEFNTDTLDRNYFTWSFGASSVWAGGTTAYIQLQNTLAKEHFSAYQLALGVRIEI